MNSDGIGLGLTIVQGIIESGGGQIKVQSKGLGHGSTFSFSIKMKASWLIEPASYQEI